MQGSIRQILASNQLVPVVTFNEGDEPGAFMDYLIENGVHCIEITLRTPQGMKAIEALKQSHGDRASIGAGTVTGKDQIDQLKSIGADFMVSPGCTPTLIEDMEASGIAYIPGVATPSEVMTARELGLHALKFFPANLFGGLQALKNYGQLFPDVAFCPTGGISADTSSTYLDLPNVIAVGGSWFQKDYQIGS